MRPIVLLGLLAALLSGCQVNTPAPASSDRPDQGSASITDQRWALVSIHGSSARLGTTVQRPWLELRSDGRVLGYTGCNRLQGSYTLEGATLTFPPLAMTRKACMANRELERGFTNGLGDTRRYALDGSQLVLFKAEQELLRFDPAAAGDASASE